MKEVTNSNSVRSDKLYRQFYAPSIPNELSRSRSTNAAAEDISESTNEEMEWATNTGINNRYDSPEAYKAVKEQVQQWGIRDVVTYIESAIGEWNTNKGMQSSFGPNGNNFDGDAHCSYLNLKRLYNAKGINNPANYFSVNIVPLSFFNRRTLGHKDLKAALASAQVLLSAGGDTFTLGPGTWAFVPRTFNNNINNLSNHALGKAIDINPADNSHIYLREDIEVIDAVCSTVLPQGLLAESNPDLIVSASMFFKQNFNDGWVACQAGKPIMAAITKRRRILDRYAARGFLNLPVTLIRGLQQAGLSWGGSWRNAKDFMHFELPNS